jgi:hypothetical protein
VIQDDEAVIQDDKAVIQDDEAVIQEDKPLWGWERCLPKTQNGYAADRSVRVAISLFRWAVEGYLNDPIAWASSS